MEEADRVYTFLHGRLGNPQSRVAKAASYVVLNKGHLWRPLVVLRTSGAYGVPEQAAMPYASLVELIHCATLILDDLPSMDDCPTRRGKPTCHIVYGVDVAELCSHYLIAEALNIATQGKASAEQKVRIISTLSATAQQLLLGQERDLHDAKSADMHALFDLYKLKSGALYAAAAVIGGILGNAHSEEVKALEEFGMNTGIAYQLGDDIYDCIGSAQALGKPTGQDVRKKTPVDVLGVDAVEDLRKKYEGKAQEAVRALGSRFCALEELVSMISGTHESLVHKSASG